tara:strand:+ start:5612 stop:5827 length:216 start_codon:yes stop_codon:yes gene_type:complete
MQRSAISYQQSALHTPFIQATSTQLSAFSKREIKVGLKFQLDPNFYGTKKTHQLHKGFDFSNNLVPLKEIK